MSDFNTQTAPPSTRGGEGQSRSIPSFAWHETSLNDSNATVSCSALSNDTMEGNIAIVGVSCRLPGDINDLSSMWDMLSSKRDMTIKPPTNRWDTDTLTSPGKNLQGLNCIREGNFLSDEVLESFDAELFCISEAEALHMDPSQRLLLKCAYESVIDAGYKVDELQGKNVGVYVGITGATETGSWLSTMAARVAQTFGLHGPASSIDTACSSSMVALNNAVECLRSHNCDTAIVLGVNTLAPRTVAAMTSPNGKFHNFDTSVNGYCRSEGCGALLLKRLSDAVRDSHGDGIYGVIRGSAVMHDGSDTCLTASNGLAQEQLIRAALSDAGVLASEVSYIEAHGTGTKLGDSVEAEALRSVYREDHNLNNVLNVSSVKGNIGYLGAAAGIGSILSAILALQYQQAPPNVLPHELNAKVAEAVRGSPIEFPREVTALERVGGGRLLAGVSSFGYSGTIAHVVLEEAPEGHGRSAGGNMSAATRAGLFSNKRHSVNDLEFAFSDQFLEEEEECLSFGSNAVLQSTGQHKSRHSLTADELLDARGNLRSPDDDNRQRLFVDRYTSSYTPSKSYDSKYQRFRRLRALGAGSRNRHLYQPLDKLSPTHNTSIESKLKLHKLKYPHMHATCDMEKLDPFDMLHQKPSSPSKTRESNPRILMLLVFFNAFLSVASLVLLIVAIHGATTDSASDLKQYGWSSGKGQSYDSIDYQVYGGALYFVYETATETSQVFSFQSCSGQDSNMTDVVGVTMCRACGGVGVPVSLLVSLCIFLSAWSAIQDSRLAWSLCSWANRTKTAPAYIVTVSLVKVTAIVFGSLVWPMNMGCHSSLGDTVEYGPGSVLFYFVWIMESVSLIILGVIRKCYFRSSKILPDLLPY